MSKEEIKARIAEIEADEQYHEELQYRFGYIFPRPLQAELYQEKKQLEAQLATL